MDYNTQRKKLILPEFGRNIQKLVDYAKELKDQDEKTKMAHMIVNIMASTNPQLKDMSDFKHTLWDQLAIISNFELDIETPYPLPEKEELLEKPNPIPYSDKKIRFKHYGKITQTLINKAIEITDKETQKALVEIIANHMKKLYLKWNREVVDNGQIIEDLHRLSKGKLSLDKDFKFIESKDLIFRPRKIKRQSRRK